MPELTLEQVEALRMSLEQAGELTEEHRAIISKFELAFSGRDGWKDDGFVEAVEEMGLGQAPELGQITAKYPGAALGHFPLKDAAPAADVELADGTQTINGRRVITAQRLADGSTFVMLAAKEGVSWQPELMTFRPGIDPFDGGEDEPVDTPVSRESVEAFTEKAFRERALTPELHPEATVIVALMDRVGLGLTKAVFAYEELKRIGALGIKIEVLPSTISDARSDVDALSNEVFSSKEIAAREPGTPARFYEKTAVVSHFIGVGTVICDALVSEGAQVTVVEEDDPLRGLAAVMGGCIVCRRDEAPQDADIFVDCVFDDEGSVFGVRVSGPLGASLINAFRLEKVASTPNIPYKDNMPIDVSPEEALEVVFETARADPTYAATVLERAAGLPDPKEKSVVAETEFQEAAQVKPAKTVVEETPEQKRIAALWAAELEMGQNDPKRRNPRDFILQEMPAGSGRKDVPSRLLSTYDGWKGRLSEDQRHLIIEFDTARRVRSKKLKNMSKQELLDHVQTQSREANERRRLKTLVVS